MKRKTKRQLTQAEIDEHNAVIDAKPLNPHYKDYPNLAVSSLPIMLEMMGKDAIFALLADLLPKEQAAKLINEAFAAGKIDFDSLRYAFDQDMQTKQIMSGLELMSRYHVSYNDGEPLLNPDKWYIVHLHNHTQCISPEFDTEQEATRAGKQGSWASGRFVTRRREKEPPALRVID